MFQYARNVNINGGAFTVNEQNGMTGALFESVVNPYVLTAIYAKVSRYCIDGSWTALPKTLHNMHQYVTQIPTRPLLLTSWAGSETPLIRPTSYGSMAQQAQARQQSLSHSANDVWLHSGSQEASSSQDMALDKAMLNFYSPQLLLGLPSPSLTLAKSLMRSLPTTHLSWQRHLRYSCRSWFLNHCNNLKFQSNLSNQSSLL